MKNSNKNLGSRTKFGTLLTLVILSLSSCEKVLETDVSTGLIAGEEVYTSNSSVGSVMNGVYLSATGLVAGGAVGYQSSLYTDDLLLTNPSNASGKSFFTNQIQSTEVAVWNQAYAQIYICNAVIAGVESSKATGLTNKNQYLGEAYFMRAWLNYLLVNVYGDVPLAVTTDYTVNNQLSRAPVQQVYSQITSDLKKAEDLLPVDYRDVLGGATTLRSRPCRAAAQALLARTYLTLQDWTNAEASANKVIGNANYQMVPLAQTFLATSKEVIFGIAPSPQSAVYVTDYALYNNGVPQVIPVGKTFASYGLNVAISDNLLTSTESGDQRLVNWIRKVDDPINSRSFYFPNKYKSNVNGAEIAVVFRLAEQYLIRAEARAMQNNFSGAKDDLNIVRTRAGLTAPQAATQATLVDAVVKERRIEYFTEIGMRFFDLKRLNRIDQVMNAIAPSKGAVWTSQKQLWPIPASEIIINPNLKQNPGYLN